MLRPFQPTAALVLGGCLGQVLPAQAPAVRDACDPAISARADDGPLGYRPRTGGEAGDPCCEGSFRSQVSAGREPRVYPVGCYAALRELEPGQEVVPLTWPWVDQGTVHVRASDRKPDGCYRMDALDLPPPRPELSDPPRGLFRWSLLVARQLELDDLDKVAVLAWQEPPPAAGEPERLLLPLAVNVPEHRIVATVAEEPVEAARVVLLLRPNRILLASDFVGEWSPHAPAAGAPAPRPAVIRARGDLLQTEVEVPADGGVWILELWLRGDDDGSEPELALAPIHVRAPTREFMAWVRARG